MAVAILIPMPLRHYVGGAKVVEVAAATVEEDRPEWARPTPSGRQAASREE